jgi:hypothetical protein
MVVLMTRSRIRSGDPKRTLVLSHLDSRVADQGHVTSRCHAAAETPVWASVPECHLKDGRPDSSWALRRTLSGVGNTIALGHDALDDPGLVLRPFEPLVWIDFATRKPLNQCLSRLDACSH